VKLKLIYLLDIIANKNNNYYYYKLCLISDCRWAEKTAWLWMLSCSHLLLTELVQTILSIFTYVDSMIFDGKPFQSSIDLWLKMNFNLCPRKWPGWNLKELLVIYFLSTWQNLDQVTSQSTFFPDSIETDIRHRSWYGLSLIGLLDNIYIKINICSIKLKWDG